MQKIYGIIQNLRCLADQIGEVTPEQNPVTSWRSQGIQLMSY
jgi:hypothetical protein